jgi:sterol 3beta-glucosyltransferase
MTLPIRDILALEKSKASRFGHHGLVIIVKGHEELFFEFGADDKRDLFVQLLERQMEDVRLRLATGEVSTPSPGKRNALILEEFERHSTSSDSIPPLADNMADSLPAVMFTSASSTFLTFKPKKSLRFTFLTIGSRGDVQPYIALAKGLIADGHRCRIATHGEFREWVESVGQIVLICVALLLIFFSKHGIEFGFVGGDPAELLRICVENGMFTVSFLRETLLKV